ncbi:uncharacterized protein LOC120011159 [Tripterygium wilfordii]|uniref:uncharacterized protein LOC120011159 n=1 Tax=Tripterygium wilfordii TaxID=458696 RepID=UPI0018F82DD7|nr:uncharacterized protein LOC120011159 [Tripterygium wilfordii]XP_038718154.1 uncharacterized protein LOC120011159 [Tripterygium wilfordii]
MENISTSEKSTMNSPNFEKADEFTPVPVKELGEEPSREMKSVTISSDGSPLDNGDGQDGLGDKINKSNVSESKAHIENLADSMEHDSVDKMQKRSDFNSNVQQKNSGVNIEKVASSHQVDEGKDFESKAEEETNESTTEILSEVKEPEPIFDGTDVPKVASSHQLDEAKDFESKAKEEKNESTTEILSEEKEPEPIFDGTEVPGMEANRSSSTRSLGIDPEAEGSAWPEKAVALTSFVKEKGVVAVATFLRRLSVKRDELGQDIPTDEDKATSDSLEDNETTGISQKAAERSAWNPLNYIKISRDNAEKKAEPEAEAMEMLLQPIVMKGRIILYTRLRCKDCKEARLFLHRKRLRYVEINIDVFPSRKAELEKFSGSSAVPKVFFNEVLIGGFDEMKGLDESDKLNEKIDYLINEAPAVEAPLPPLSGEDDVSSNGALDELAVIVRKMKQFLIIKDRFYKMRRFTNCFVGSDAVDFLSEDQYLERDEAIEFGRKLASKLFFQHVLEENLFEDGNHLYRFFDDDPVVASQCHNIPRGIIDVKPKPIIEIASRLRFLSYAIFEAYTSEDGRHVDYRSIHGSEEFARYLRTVQELHRVELQDMRREDKLTFFINLYNMMAIHAILEWGYPVGALERRKMFGDFKYVIGGCTYSLSAIQNGVLRGNQRPPYNLMKPFGVKDKRFKVALPYPEHLIHFALVFGSRSGPALRCYSPANIDKELMEATRNYLRGGGLIVDLQANVALVSKILKWYSIDFGKNEAEVLKHASNYLEPANSEALLEMLADTRLKVIYQPYDWSLNL